MYVKEIEVQIQTKYFGIVALLIFLCNYGKCSNVQNKTLKNKYFFISIIRKN